MYPKEPIPLISINHSHIAAFKQFNLIFPHLILIKIEIKSRYFIGFQGFRILFNFIIVILVLITVVGYFLGCLWGCLGFDFGWIILHFIGWIYLVFEIWFVCIVRLWIWILKDCPVLYFLGIGLLIGNGLIWILYFIGRIGYWYLNCLIVVYFAGIQGVVRLSLKLRRILYWNLWIVVLSCGRLVGGLDFQVSYWKRCLVSVFGICLLGCLGMRFEPFLLILRWGIGRIIFRFLGGVYLGWIF